VPGALLFREKAYPKGKGAQAEVAAFQNVHTRGGLADLKISPNGMCCGLSSRRDVHIESRVIASEAKQSSSFGRKILDCFVAMLLAMTAPAIALHLTGFCVILRPKQCEVDNVQPAQNAVDDCPEYRMVVGVRYRDGKSAAKAHAILRTLDSNSVVAIFVHVAGLSARAETHKFRSCPLRSNNDHFCAGAANDAKGQERSYG
jgi:hypothetical protein